jgi:hypothetical protein
MSVLEKVRRWIDGESAELVLENAARDAQVKPRSKAEEFIVKIAREVESVMQNEMLPLPQGTTIIPTEYTIFLNADDDRQWQGVKRRGLEQGLYHILAERAKEIAGKKKLETKSFVIELRIDATLQPARCACSIAGKIRPAIKPVCSAGLKTFHLCRKLQRRLRLVQTNPNFTRPAGSAHGVTSPSLGQLIPPTGRGH